MNTLQKSVSRLNNLSWTHIVLIGLSVGGGYVLWNRYGDQLVNYLPYLLLLLCPLMHVFMHRGHGGQAHHKDHQGDNE
jgi:hypothetical protein